MATAGLCMSSTIGPARAALFALLSAAAADNTNPLYNVQVTFGPPDQYEEQEVVALLGVADPADTPDITGPAGAVTDEERYSLGIAVKSYSPAGDAMTVDARGWAMANAVRAVIVAHRDMSATVFESFPGPQRCPAGVVRPVTADVDGRQVFEPGWVIHIEMSAECVAYIA